MKIHEYYNLLSPSQQLIVAAVKAEAAKSDATKQACKKLRTVFAQRAVAFFDYKNAQKIRLGFEPDWETVDIEWDVAINAAKTWPSLLTRILSFLGFQNWVLNFVLGLNLPSGIDAESRRSASVAINMASIFVSIDK